MVADFFLIVQQLNKSWTRIEQKLNKNWTKIVFKYIGSLQPICFDFTKHSLKKFVYEHLLYKSRTIP